MKILQEALEAVRSGDIPLLDQVIRQIDPGSPAWEPCQLARAHITKYGPSSNHFGVSLQGDRAIYGQAVWK